MFRCPFRISDIKKMRIFHQKKVEKLKNSRPIIVPKNTIFPGPFLRSVSKKNTENLKWHQQETAGEVSGVGGKYRCRHFTVDVHHKNLRIYFVDDGFNSIHMCEKHSFNEYQPRKYIAVDLTKLILGICGPSLHIWRMGDYMNMSLDAIIALNKIDVGNHRNSNDVNRNTYVNRNMKDKFERPSRDCNDRGSSLSPRMSSRTSTRQITKNLISIKFLISNELSGSMIGPGGAAIKELMDTTR